MFEFKTTPTILDAITKWLSCTDSAKTLHCLAHPILSKCICRDKTFKFHIFSYFALTLCSLSLSVIL